MTPSFIRGRPRSATPHPSVRVADALLGATAGVVWLVLPTMTTGTEVPVVIKDQRPVAVAPAPDDGDDETPTADLVLPLIAVGTAGVLAGYGYLRRTRRARTRTTPGGAAAGPTAPPPAALDERTRVALVEADDWVRTGHEELSYAEALHGTAAVAPWARALREAGTELSAAFRIRQRYDDGLPGDPTARRHALAGIAGRCEEAGRRLDTEAAGFDRLRGLELDVGAALEVAEARFRELTARTAAARATLAGLERRYARSATAPVTGNVEQATDRLVFATARLNLAHQAADGTDHARAAGHLRAAEGAVAQAGVLVTGVERLAAELSAATELVPAALTGAEALLAGERERSTAGGEARVRLRYADGVLGTVREELTGGPYDPLGVLRRIVRAVGPSAAAQGGVLSVAALSVARSTTAAADDVVGTHRGAVGAEARTRLAEAQRLLGTDPPDPEAADALARQARDLAEQDIHRYGRPDAGAAGDPSGTAGAVLGGVLLGGGPDGGPPPSFGGPRTRARRGT
ncbi:hypothetical protein [Streptomyces viridiviolaceus]|uniref:hypothetical protein n=1 Tax=Streptomyces viridiviolaceus TaxID=68282 RepID=UPI0027E57634|nr:hypothetical protein [Streptomyces viridiviolaceus]